MMRSIVCAVSCVCSVAKTRCPVSAAVSAVEIVSRSRISPTRITSGSSRSAAFSASEKLCASAPSSRWLTRHFLCACRNSIGSSIVMMCSSRVRLISSIIAASEVDLPEPVGPVTSTKPRGRLAKSCTTAGSPSSSMRAQVEGDQAKRRADRAALEVGVDTKARVTGDRVGEVELPVRLQALALVAGEDRVDDLARVRRRELRIVLERRQAAAHARRSGARRRSGEGPRRVARRPPSAGLRNRCPWHAPSTYREQRSRRVEADWTKVG